MYLWFFLLEDILLVSLVQQVVLVLQQHPLLPGLAVPAVAVQGQQSWGLIHSFPSQSVLGLLHQLSDAYYKTSVYLFLSWQRTRQTFYHTNHHDHHPANPTLLLAGRQIRIKTGKNSSSLLALQLLGNRILIGNDVP